MAVDASVAYLLCEGEWACERVVFVRADVRGACGVLVLPESYTSTSCIHYRREIGSACPKIRECVIRTPVLVMI